MMIYRIRWKDLAVVECDGKSVSKSKSKFPEAVNAAQLFLKNGKLDLIRDGKFLKGEFCNGEARGKRINVLPNGVKLNKGFLLFAKKLTIHDERSHGHWDVMFESPNRDGSAGPNSSGKFVYLYSLNKVRLSNDKKYRLVDDFEKCLPRLRRNLMKELGTSDLVLAMLILLKTKMRVGGEIYYKRSRHKGLSTLKKKNLKIVGNEVRFDFVGKDGVPQVLKEKFGKRIISELKRVLKGKGDNDFVFLDSNGKVFGDACFEAEFERICGKRFYPHIVRSHFATREVEKFLARKRKADVKKFCLGLASKLGHKKFSKKDGEWKENFEMTLHYYVRPDLAERIGEMLKKG